LTRGEGEGHESHEWEAVGETGAAAGGGAGGRGGARRGFWESDVRLNSSGTTTTTGKNEGTCTEQKVPEDSSQVIGGSQTDVHSRPT